MYGIDTSGILRYVANFNIQDSEIVSDDSNQISVYPNSTVNEKPLLILLHTPLLMNAGRSIYSTYYTAHVD